ncbi:MAG: hypothetical protein AAGA08_01365 [Pseudomonadota bacterium]
MELSNRFRVFAKSLFWFTTAVMIALVIMVLTFAVSPDFAKSTLMRNAPDDLTILVPPTTATVYALLASGCVALGLQFFVLWNMRALFRLYAQGQALSAACGGHIARIGAGVIAIPFAGVFYDAMSSFLLTRHNPPGQGEVSIGIQTTSIGLMVGGGMLLLVGAAMLEASRQADENRSFV